MKVLSILSFHVCCCSARISNMNKKSYPRGIMIQATLLVSFLLAAGVFVIAYELGIVSRRNHQSQQDQLNPLSLSPTIHELKYDKFVNSIPLEKGSKEGWVKYVNTQQGYSVEFPSRYTSDTMIQDALTLYDVESDAGIGERASRNGIKIDIYAPHNVTDPPVTESLRAYIEEGIQKDSGIVAQQVSWTKLNGQDIAVEDIGNILRYYLYNGGHIYVIDKTQYNPALSEEFDTILSSIKFLK